MRVDGFAAYANPLPFGFAVLPLLLLQQLLRLHLWLLLMLLQQPAPRWLLLLQCLGVRELLLLQPRLQGWALLL